MLFNHLKNRDETKVFFSSLDYFIMPANCCTISCAHKVNGTCTMYKAVGHTVAIVVSVLLCSASSQRSVSIVKHGMENILAC